MHLQVLNAGALHTSPSSTEPVIGLGKPVSALACLSVAPQRTVSRASLLSLLWADLEPDAAKHALRQTLWYLKKKTGRDLVIADGDTLRLADFVTVDRDALLEASRAGDHERVVELYTGPFIPNFAAPGGAGFEEWAALERRRLIEVFRHSAEALIAARLASGHARDAIALARRLRDQDLYYLSGWRLLIEACLSANDQLAARAEAEALAQLADREELELDPATRAALRAARTPPGASTPDAASDTIAPSLVGREDAFATLLDAWESARSGRLARVHVTARAGIGKSRLLRDFGSRIKALRGKVVAVTGALGTREVECAVASELAAGLAMLPGKQALSNESAATLVELNPSLSTFFDKPGRASDRGDRMRNRAIALRELLRAVSFEHPLVLLVEDLHWWDEASVSLIGAALEGAGDTRVLLVTSGRPEVRHASLVTGSGTLHVGLEPLTAEHIEELVLSVAALPNDSWASTFATDVWRATRGSPLLALELLQHLEQRQLLTREQGVWRSRHADLLAVELAQGNVLRTRLDELERGDHWLLTLLAASGAPVSAEVLAAAAGRTSDELMHRLTALEARGFALRDGDSWKPSHDEIADEVLKSSSHESAVRAASQLGRALGASDALDETRARRAMQLLRGADDAASRGQVLHRYALRRYARGDRRPIGAIAAELLGSSAGPKEVAALSRTAPLTWRLGLVSSGRRMFAAAAAVLAGTVAAFGLITRPAAPPPDAIIGLIYADSTGRLSYEQVELRADAWAPREGLPVKPWTGPDLTLLSGNGFNIDYAPATGAFVTAQAVADSGIIDLFYHAPGEAARPFLSAVRDDVGPTFSPDGSQIVYATARWDSLFRYDLALAGINDTVPRQLTRGASSDGNPRWSPDGTRIVFGRSNWGVKPNEICVIDLPAGREECKAIASPRYDPQPLGWLDRDRIVVRQSANDLNAVSILQWSTGDVLPLLPDVGSRAELSPDAEWIVCECTLTTSGDKGLAVMPTAAPQLVRPIGSHTVPARFLRGAVWIRSNDVSLALEVHISPQRMVHRGVPAQMRANLYDQRGASLRNLSGVRWSVSRGATIDSISGILTATGETNEVMVWATAGAVARDSITVAVDSRSAILTVDERWANMDRWASFGAPVPTLGTTPDGTRAMFNNGEGSFESGLIALDSVAADRGVAIDVDVSSPVTLPQWQLVRISLGTTDPASHKRATGVNAFPFYNTDYSHCDFGYPQEGRLSGLESLVTISAREATARLPFEGLHSGRWWTLRVQLLPDGRCGYAINGKPLGVLNSSRNPRRIARVRLAGNSYNTRIAVGRVRVWQGVLTDIDWSKVPVIK